MTDQNAQDPRHNQDVAYRTNYLGKTDENGIHQPYDKIPVKTVAFGELTLPDGSRMNLSIQHPNPRVATESFLNEVAHWTGKPIAMAGEMKSSTDRLGYKDGGNWKGKKKNYVDQSKLPPLEARFEVATLKIWRTSTDKLMLFVGRLDGKTAACWDSIVDSSGIGSHLVNESGIIWAQLKKGDIIEAAPINQRTNAVLVAYTATEADGKQNVTKLALEPAQFGQANPGGGTFATPPQSVV